MKVKRALVDNRMVHEDGSWQSHFVVSEFVQKTLEILFEPMLDLDQVREEWESRSYKQ